MKNILCFIFEEFSDFEINFTCLGFKLPEDYQVVYFAYEKTPVKSTTGMTVTPDKTITEVSQMQDIEGLIIPGGGTGRMVKYELEQLVNKLNNEKKLIAAICAGPVYLAKMGFLNSRKYTTSLDPQYFEENNEIDPFPRDTYVDARVVQDDNLITAKWHAFIDFALEISDWFNLYDYDSEKEELKKLLTPT